MHQAGLRKTTDRSETKVDGAGGEAARLEMHSISNDHGLAERQSRLGTVPLHEFVDGMPITALSIGAGKTVEDRGFRGFEVGQSQDRFGAPALFFPIRFLLHDLW